MTAKPSLSFFCLIQQQKPAPIWEGLSASLHQSLQWCQCKDSALPVLIPAVLWSTSRQLCPPKPARTMQEKMIKQREMGVRASPLPPQGYWALPRSASGWHSWIWAASLKHTLFLLCFSQSSQRDRILLVSGKWEYPPSTQLTTCPLSSFCTGKCFRDLYYIHKNTRGTWLCHHTPTSVNIIMTLNHAEVFPICVPKGWQEVISPLLQTLYFEKKAFMHILVDLNTVDLAFLNHQIIRNYLKLDSDFETSSN